MTTACRMISTTPHPPSPQHTLTLTLRVCSLERSSKFALLWAMRVGAWYIYISTGRSVGTSVLGRRVKPPPNHCRQTTRSLRGDTSLINHTFLVNVRWCIQWSTRSRTATLVIILRHSTYTGIIYRLYLHVYHTHINGCIHCFWRGALSMQFQ